MVWLGNWLVQWLSFKLCSKTKTCFATDQLVNVRWMASSLVLAGRKLGEINLRV